MRTLLPYLTDGGLVLHIGEDGGLGDEDIYGEAVGKAHTKGAPLNKRSRRPLAYVAPAG
jgi:hypothetical protein